MQLVIKPHDGCQYGTSSRAVIINDDEKRNTKSAKQMYIANPNLFVKNVYFFVNDTAVHRYTILAFIAVNIE